MKNSHNKQMTRPIYLDSSNLVRQVVKHQWSNDGLAYFKCASQIINKANPFKMFVKGKFNSEDYSTGNKLFSLEIPTKLILTELDNIIFDMDLSSLRFVQTQLLYGDYKEYFKNFLGYIYSSINDFKSMIKRNYSGKRKISYSMLTLLWCERVYFKYISFMVTLAEAAYSQKDLGVYEIIASVKTIANGYKYFLTVVMPEYHAISRKIRADHKETADTAWHYLFTSVNIFKKWQKAAWSDVSKEWFYNYEMFRK